MLAPLVFTFDCVNRRIFLGRRAVIFPKLVVTVSSYELHLVHIHVIIPHLAGAMNKNNKVGRVMITPYVQRQQWTLSAAPESRPLTYDWSFLQRKYSASANCKLRKLYDSAPSSYTPFQLTFISHLYRSFPSLLILFLHLSCFVLQYFALDFGMTC